MLIFISILIIITVLMVLGYPLFRGRLEEAPVDAYGDRRLREILSRKESVYETIKELDFDFKTDKLSEKDYKELRERYRRQALSLLEESDAVEKGEDVESFIEREIFVRRKTSSSLKGKEEKSDDIEGMIEEEILARRESLPICPHCGSGYGEKDQFCSNCGRKLR